MVRLSSRNELQKPPRLLARAARTRLGCSAQVTWNSKGQSLKYTLCRVTSPHRPEAETGIRGADKAHLPANDFVYSYFCAAGNEWLQSTTCQLGRKQQFCMAGNGNISSSAPPPRSQIFSLLAEPSMDRGSIQ